MAYQNVETILENHNNRKVTNCVKFESMILERTNLIDKRGT